MTNAGSLANHLHCIAQRGRFAKVNVRDPGISGNGRRKGLWCSTMPTRDLPHDPRYVNLNDPFEVRRWCQKFVCAEPSLREAVRSVGSRPADVLAELRRRGLCLKGLAMFTSKR